MSKCPRAGGRTIGCVAALLLLTGAPPLAAQGTLFVEGENVGIGTPSPLVPLHVVETSGSPTLKNMLRLTNNGGVMFLLERTDGNDWQFSNFNASFQISIPGGPQAQFQVNSNGDVLAGNRMFATQFLTSSSRELKRDIRPVDVHDVLERLSSVPVAEWTFKGEGTRHVGPMAEDFQAAFGLGQSGTGLSLTDTNGVALAAIQALHAELQSLRKQVDDQSQLLEEQRQEIQALRAQNDLP
jgi:hypothetical protein